MAQNRAYLGRDSTMGLDRSLCPAAVIHPMPTFKRYRYLEVFHYSNFTAQYHGPCEMGELSAIMIAGRQYEVTLP